MDIRESVHSSQAKTFDTDQLREHFLIESVFSADQINLTYSHVDRVIAGGCCPVTKPVVLEAGKEIAADFFLARRELGAINIGGAGVVIVDGEEFAIDSKEAIYIGMGAKEVAFTSCNSEEPAKFYINSAPAHHAYPTRKITQDQASPETLGDPENCNQRTIYKYLVPSVVDTCQLAMGMTVLAPGSIWNTFPCHTHERRMEVYFYFNMDESNAVFHMMGKPEETRHLVVRNEQAVISPSWSIHSGVGTSNYTFIWGMAGENQEFSDMDFVDTKNLR